MPFMIAVAIVPQPINPMLLEDLWLSSSRLVVVAIAPSDNNDLDDAALLKNGCDEPTTMGRWMKRFLLDAGFIVEGRRR